MLTALQINSQVLLLVYHDAAAANDGRLGVVILPSFVVVCYLIRLWVPNLDSEFVLLVINRGQHKLEASFQTIDRALAFELGFSPRNNQPFIGAALKPKVAGLESKLGVTLRNGCSFLVLGNETEVGLACEGWIGYVGSGR